MTVTSPNYSQTNYTSAGQTGVTCGTIGEFIVVGTGHKVRWCAIGDPTDWPAVNTDDARAKQAGEQALVNSYGIVTGIAGNDFFGYVFQERAITKMTYVGGDVVFRFDTFEEDRGCHNENRYVQVDDKVFFESNDGYHMLENDQIFDIGHGFVDDTFSF